HPTVGILLFVAPIAFLGVEFYTVGARFDMTGKIWGFIFCSTWAAFIPALATSRRWLFQALFFAIALNCTLSIAFWTNYYWQNIAWDKDVGDLQGKGDLGWDSSRARILNALLPLKNQIITSGKSS